MNVPYVVFQMEVKYTEKIIKNSVGQVGNENARE